MHHFIAFGCLDFVHILEVQTKELDVKSIKCVILGISDESKAYKIYDWVEKKIMVNRDVMFEEYIKDGNGESKIKSTHKGQLSILVVMKAMVKTSMILMIQMKEKKVKHERMKTTAMVLKMLGTLKNNKMKKKMMIYLTGQRKYQVI